MSRISTVGAAISDLAEFHPCQTTGVSQHVEMPSVFLQQPLQAALSLSLSLSATLELRLMPHRSDFYHLGP